MPELTWTTELAWISVLLLLCMVAPTSAAYNRLGIANAWPGAKCLTEDGAIATLTVRDRQQLGSIMSSPDDEAWRQLFERGIAMRLRQLTVFVEDRDGGYVKVRPEGRLESLWVATWELECTK
jgi:hypothetical protein